MDDSPSQTRDRDNQPPAWFRRQQRYIYGALCFVSVALIVMIGLYIASIQQDKTVSNERSIDTDSREWSGPTAGNGNISTQPPTQRPTSRLTVQPPFVKNNSDVGTSIPASQTPSSHPSLYDQSVRPTQYTSKEISPGQFEENTGESEEDDPIVGSSGFMPLTRTDDEHDWRMCMGGMFRSFLSCGFAGAAADKIRA